MSDVVIRAENLGKKYRIQHQLERQRYTALRDVVADKFLAPWRYFSNLKSRISNLPATEDFWALKDVSFEIKQGEVVGIIGRNGAGKSTLLKILSRITEPTTGRVGIKGRVASLLEVGTGFHPELTGRENIYLNGAVLGMTRMEVKLKFDEIVAFAEIDKFLDTPVKRYSSGMYMRLAFAVAAHLEPEILIVDEVLAVGDAEFQNKCIGKMSEVAHTGRTVIFVSHNMAAITSLTSKAILLASGKIIQRGNTSSVVQHYSNVRRSINSDDRFYGKGNYTRIRAAVMIDENGESTQSYKPGEQIHLAIEFETDGAPGMSIEVILLDPGERRLALSSFYQYYGKFIPSEPGVYQYEIVFDPLWLAAGNYTFDITTSVANVSWDHYVNEAIEFEVPFSNPEGQPWDFNYNLGFGSIALRSPSTPKFTSLGYQNTEYHKVKNEKTVELH